MAEPSTAKVEWFLILTVKTDVDGAVDTIHQYIIVVILYHVPDTLLP